MKKPSVYEVLQLAHQAANELAFTLANQNQLKLLTAKNITENIIYGKIDANIGCLKIRELNHELGWSEEFFWVGIIIELSGRRTCALDSL